MANRKDFDQGNNRYRDNFYEEIPQRRKSEGYGRNGGYHRNGGGTGRKTPEFIDIDSGRPVRFVRMRRRSGIFSFLFTLLFLLLILFAGLYIFLSVQLNTKSISEDLGASGSYGNQYTNIALFGLDDRSNAFAGRSDVMMVLTVDHKHGKLKLTSLLRDSSVEIPGYGWDKLNHAYAYGGPELAIRTVNENFDMDISNYVTVNFYNMADIVDAFGGTVVTITEAEMWEINNNLDLLVADEETVTVDASDYMSDWGEVRLNGAQAVAYARIRNIDSDAVRASRQQNVMQGLLSSLRQMSPLGYVNLVTGSLPHCETSMGVGGIMGIVPGVLRSGGNLETLSIPGPEENPTDGYTDAGNWVYVYDLPWATKHIDAFIKENDSAYWSDFYD